MDDSDEGFNSLDDDLELSYNTEEVDSSEPVIDESLRYAAPELAMGFDLSQTAQHGSPQAQRRSKMLRWGLLVFFGLPFVVGLVMLFYSMI